MKYLLLISILLFPLSTQAGSRLHSEGCGVSYDAAVNLASRYIIENHKSAISSKTTVSEGKLTGDKITSQARSTLKDRKVHKKWLGGTSVCVKISGLVVEEKCIPGTVWSPKAGECFPDFDPFFGGPFPKDAL